MIFANLRKFFTKIRNPWWRNKKKYVKFYEELEIDDRAILIESQHGTEMNGNVFYIIKYLCGCEKFHDYKIYLTTRPNKRARFEKLLEFYGLSGVNLVILASEEYYRIIASAKYLINDNTFLPFFIKKEGQVYLNTWHGTPLKTLGRKMKSDSHAIGNTQRNFVFSDILTFPNEHTKNALIEDYMISDISSGSYVMTGYPRNEIFFNEQRRTLIKEELDITDKRLYAYMPTFRGAPAKGGTPKNAYYLNYYLYELDKRLNDDEILYVNLHPVATKNVNFKEFVHIKAFPANYETYDFLNACDVLVSDYSSVFFDYACSRRKIILFTYDKEEYLRDRGTYTDIDSLPFPKVDGVDALISELRSDKNYSDEAFLDEFCRYDSANASQVLCDFVILGENSGLIKKPIPSNGKENVLIYAGNLAGNGVTASLMSLLNTVDTSERNYYITFRSELVYRNRSMLQALPENVRYFAISDDMNLKISDHIKRALFKKNKISAKRFMSLCEKRVRDGFIRCYARAKFNHVIQFNGYEHEIILMFSTFGGGKTIFVHSNMLMEMKTRKNQRKDVLKYAYNNFTNVAIVTEDMRASTLKISGRNDNIRVIKNTINYASILERMNDDITEDSFQKSNAEYSAIMEALDSTDEKFINIGRFSPEKGQDRLIRAFAKYHAENPASYLFIIGGSSTAQTYEKLVELISELSLENRVILLFNMPNPYAALKKCDYFILSSHYEGFGLVLAEADILGKPVISTDIEGPRTFMKENGGILVENSENGILRGIKLLSESKVKPMGVDYARYNAETVKEFNKLFNN